MNTHRQSIKDKKDTVVAMHFNSTCTLKDFSVQPIEIISGDGRTEKSTKQRKLREAFWIKELRTIYPYGLNDRCNGQDWSNRDDDSIASTIFNRTRIFRKKHSNKKIHHWSRNWKHEEFFQKVIDLYNNHDDWIFFSRKTVSSLSLKVLKRFLLKLDELCWDLDEEYPRIILEVIQDLVKGRIFFMDVRNNKKNNKNFFNYNFLKVYFHNKGIELVQLNKLLNKVNSCIPRSFSNTDNPTVIYKRSPTIARKIFNYKLVINSINVNDWKNDESCNCQTSSFCNPHHKHIITGDLKIIENRDLRHLLMKGPNYREPCVINWKKVVDCIKAGVMECQTRWASQENAAPVVLNEWSASLMNLVRNRVHKLKKLNRFRYSAKKSILNKPIIKTYLQQLHDRYVFVPTDKASNNIAVICKYYYIKLLFKEIGLFDNKQQSAYTSISDSAQVIIAQHMKNMEELKINIDEKQQQLPILLWIPKMHKKPSRQDLLLLHIVVQQNQFLL
jgi:hypothetical protein